DDSVARIAQAFPDLEIIRSDSNLGYAGGNELALQRALVDGETELFWILNNDALAHPDSLSHFVSAYRQFGDAVYSGVPLTPESQQGEWIIQMTLRSTDPRSGALLLTKLHGLRHNQYFADLQPRPTAVADGSTMMIPLSVVRQHGFMDTSF